MSRRRSGPPQPRGRPFIKLSHLEDLELSNRDLAIYVRLLWYLDDEVWRRGGVPGVAPIRERALRDITGTSRADHAEKWLLELLDRFPGSHWIPLQEENGGLDAAYQQLATRLPELGATKSQLDTSKASFGQIRGFILFPNYAESQQLGTQTRPDSDRYVDTDPDADQIIADPDADPHQTSPDQEEEKEGGEVGGSRTQDFEQELSRVSDRVPPSPRVPDTTASTNADPPAASAYRQGGVGCPTFEELMEDIRAMDDPHAGMKDEDPYPQDYVGDSSDS